ncbi:MAG: hypothetical protein AAF862_12355, partial [Pseudomonadota bacterium]
MAQQITPKFVHHHLQLYWEDPRKPPKLQWADWLDEFRMYSLHRAHLRQMQQGKTQRYDDLLRQTSAQAVKCHFQQASECEMIKGSFVQEMRAVSGAEQKLKQELLIMPCDDTEQLKIVLTKIEAFDKGRSEKSRLSVIQSSTPTSVLNCTPDVSIKEEPISNINFANGYGTPLGSESLTEQYPADESGLNDSYYPPGFEEYSQTEVNAINSNCRNCGLRHGPSTVCKAANS